MKQKIERRKPEGFLDYFSLAVTTLGVGYLPVAPGTWGSALGVIIFLAIAWLEFGIGVGLRFHQGWSHEEAATLFFAINLVMFFGFALLGVWASGRSTELFGDLDPSHAIVDEVMGQLIVFAFVPTAIVTPITNWFIILLGLLLFRLFDIWKPYPIDDLQVLPGGIGVCADDILAGVYAGICLAVIYAISLSI